MREVVLSIAETEEDGSEEFYRKARADYRLGQYCLFEVIGDVEAQTKLCSDLIFWLQRVGELELAQQFQNKLVELLTSQGNSDELAKALYRQGRQLFFNGKHEDAANLLRQFALLAEQLEDGELVGYCYQYLGYTEFFLH